LQRSIPVAVKWNRARLLCVVDVALHPLKLIAISTTTT
jgi:hypothetical protein